MVQYSELTVRVWTVISRLHPFWILVACGREWDTSQVDPNQGTELALLKGARIAQITRHSI